MNTNDNFEVGSNFYRKEIVYVNDFNEFPSAGKNNNISFPHNINLSPQLSSNINDDRDESRGTGITQTGSNLQGSRLLGHRGIPGCGSCGGSGYKTSTDKYGIHKTCESCANLSIKYLPRCRGISTCKKCSGEGFYKSFFNSVKPCKSCLYITNYCENCLNTGYKLLTGKLCMHKT